MSVSLPFFGVILILNIWLRLSYSLFSVSGLWDGVEFPASNEGVEQFEDINDRTLSFNVDTINPDGTNSMVVDRVTKFKSFVSCSSIARGT